MSQIILLPLIGFIVGLLIISLGGGGGAIYVGILTVIFHVPPAIAASTSLATIIPTTAMGSFSHWRNGNVKLRYGFIMLIGGVLGTVIGSLCSGLLPKSLYNKLTGIILLLLAVQMFLSFLKKSKQKNKQTEVDGESNKLTKGGILKAVVFGLLSGLMSGIIGLSGGGPIMTGLALLGCGTLEIVGTSVFVMLGISIAGFSIHVGLGNIDWKLVGLLAVGTTLGAFVGPNILKRFDKKTLEKVLQPIIVCMLAIMGAILLFQ